MSISMIGIDHTAAPVDIRAVFAFTRKNVGEAMEKIKEKMILSISWKFFLKTLLRF